MRATLNFIVQVEDSYNNYIDLGDDARLSVNNSIESVKHINRVGKVISAPKGTVVKEGDFVLFHHNICRESWGLKSKRKKSPFSLFDKVFFVPPTEIFMYKKSDSDEWSALSPFVFIKPIPSSVVTLSNGLKVKEESYKGMRPLEGLVAYPNSALIDMGVSKGDTVAFQENSEHEYEILGEIFYKMRNPDILAVL
jgi:hypothetical protein